LPRACFNRTIMKIQYCEKCGRVILMGFEYCPYCGVLIRSMERDKVDGETGTCFPEEDHERLERLIRDLDKLDAELSEMDIRKR
jgi:hypothetical protein